jgi:hypothetical protein
MMNNIKAGLKKYFPATGCFCGIKYLCFSKYYRCFYGIVFTVLFIEVSGWRWFGKTDLRTYSHHLIWVIPA